MNIVGALTIVAVLAGMLAPLIWTRPLFTLIVVLCGAGVLDCLHIGADGLNLGVFIYPDDIVCAIGVFAGVLTAVRRRQLPPGGSWPLFMLGSQVALSFARGLQEFGLKAAGNSIRTLSYIVLPALSVLLVRKSCRLDARSVGTTVCGIGSVFAVIALGRWLGLVPTPPELLHEAFRDVVRVLPADYAMLIGQAIISLLYLQELGFAQRWRVAVAGSLILIVLALQHRSVWVATFFGILWLAVKSARFSRVLLLQVMGTTLALCAIVAVLSLASNTMSRVADLFISNIQETQQEGNTWQWRVNGWSEATSRLLSSDVADLLIGPPAGLDWGSTASFASTHIHNRYVDTLANYGLFGGLLLVCWLIGVARETGRMRIRGQLQDRRKCLDKAFLQALLLSQLVYFVPYFGGILQGLVIALVWSAALNAGEFTEPRSKTVLPTTPLWKHSLLTQA